MTRPRPLLLPVLLLACRGEGEILDLTATDDPPLGACPLVLLDAAPGLAVTPALTSDWDTGSCYELTLQNTAAAPLTWWIQLTVQGTTTDRWNHTPQDLGGGLFEWRGTPSSNNLQLAPAATTTVGTCLAC